MNTNLLNHTQTPLKILSKICWDNRLPSNIQIIEMLEMLIFFIEDTRSRKGIQMYKPLNEKAEATHPVGFDYKRDIRNAMKDFFLDHPEEKNIKWGIPFKFLIEPIINTLCETYNHDDLMYYGPQHIKQCISYFNECYSERTDETKEPDYIKKLSTHHTTYVHYVEEA
jgi:hypothetical protein